MILYKKLCIRILLKNRNHINLGTIHFYYLNYNDKSSQKFRCIYYLHLNLSLVNSENIEPLGNNSPRITARILKSLLLKIRLTNFKYYTFKYCSFYRLAIGTDGGT